MSRRRKPFPLPPPVGTRWRVKRLCGTHVERSGEDVRKHDLRSLGPGTLVEVCEHSHGHAHYYGAGCFVTPVAQGHKDRWKRFYLANSELDVLEKA